MTMHAISLEEAQSSLPELIHRLSAGEFVVITENGQPVARLVGAEAQPRRKTRKAGTLRGTVRYMAPDFDAPLDDFQSYVQ